MGLSKTENDKLIKLHEERKQAEEGIKKLIVEGCKNGAVLGWGNSVIHLWRVSREKETEIKALLEEVPLDKLTRQDLELLFETQGNIYHDKRFYTYAVVCGGINK